MEAVLDQPAIVQGMQVIKMNVTDTEIATLKSEYMSLTINGIEDKAGLKKVYEARQVVKKTRTGLVKFAEGLKEDALEFQRKVNKEQKRVVSELEAIEAHLQAEEDKIDTEKEAIRLKAEQAESARVQARIDALAAYGFGVDYETVKIIDDNSFAIVLKNARAEYEKEEAAKAEQERLDQIERERMEAERKELQLLREQQAAAQKIIDENNARIKKEQDAKDLAQKIAAQKLEAERQRMESEKKRQEELESARIEAAEKARMKAIKDAENERIRLAEEKRIAEEEANRQASLRPDKEKLQTLVGVFGNITLPIVSAVAAQDIVNDVQVMISKVQAHIIKKIKAL
jgi:hypothetical protein